MTNAPPTFLAQRATPLSRRWLITGFTTVFVATAVVIAPALLPDQAMSIPEASADSCPSVQVVFARGTGEDPGVGLVGQAFVDSLRTQVGGGAVAVYPVDYPACHDFLRAADGANDASTFVQNLASTCPATKIVLGGYSQGAAVIDAVTVATHPILGFTDPMPAEVADHVAAVAVLGNPSNRLGGPLTTLSPLYGDKTIDLCNGADPVCSNGDDAAAHSLYVQSGMTTQAATFAATQITNDPRRDRHRGPEFLGIGPTAASPRQDEPTRHPTLSSQTLSPFGLDPDGDDQSVLAAIDTRHANVIKRSPPLNQR